MELLDIRLIRLEASRRLRKNLARAISLVFITLFSIFFMFIVNELIAIFIRSFGVTSTLTESVGVADLISVICSTLIGLTFIMPLWLNIKKWYTNLSEDAPPVATTLSMVSSPRIYFKTVGYCVIKSLISFITTFVLLLPSVFLAVIVKIQFMDSSVSVGILPMLIVVMMIVFALIAILYAVYIHVGLFYADYIWISDITTNPLKAIALSLKIAKHNRTKIITLFVSFIPYILVSVFIIPLIFTIPMIQSTLACFAKGQLETYIYQKSQQDLAYNL